jgi:CRP-like cAMP-binding protein
MEKKKEIAQLISERYYKLSRIGIDKLAVALVPFKLKKGETLVNRGEVCNYIFFIEKGMVRQFYFKYNKDLTENFSYEGDMLTCLESFLLKQPSQLLIETLENTASWGISHQDWMRLTDESKEINMLYRSILEYGLILSQRKADMLRFEPAHVRYNRLLESFPQILQRAPLVHIASFLQMTPETLSRVRSGQL